MIIRARNQFCMTCLRFPTILEELGVAITQLTASTVLFYKYRHPVTGQWFDCDDSYVREIGDIR